MTRAVRASSSTAAASVVQKSASSASACRAATSGLMSITPRTCTAVWRRSWCRSTARTSVAGAKTRHCHTAGGVGTFAPAHHERVGSTGGASLVGDTAPDCLTSTARASSTASRAKGAGSSGGPG